MAHLATGGGMPPSGSAAARDMVGAHQNLNASRPF